MHDLFIEAAQSGRLLSCLVPPMKSLELYSCLPLLVRLQPSKIEPEAAILVNYVP